MADLGSIGTQGTYAYQNEDCCPRLTTHRGVVICGRMDFPWVTAAKDSVVGSGAAPSLRMDGKGYYRFFWTVKAGARTLYVYVKQAANLNPRPRVTILKNTSIGQNVDLSWNADAGTGWVLCGPIITSTLSGDGVLEVRLYNQLDAQIGVAPCYWDDISSS